MDVQALLCPNQASGWDVSNVEDMEDMFYLASVFNQDLNGWVVDSVTRGYGAMFYGKAFNQPIGDGASTRSRIWSTVFLLASAFDQNLGWCVADHVDLDDAFDPTCESALVCVARTRPI